MENFIFCAVYTLNTEQANENNFTYIGCRLIGWTETTSMEMLLLGNSSHDAQTNTHILIKPLNISQQLKYLMSVFMEYDCLIFSKCLVFQMNILVFQLKYLVFGSKTLDFDRMGNFEILGFSCLNLKYLIFRVEYLVF